VSGAHVYAVKDKFREVCLLAGRIVLISVAEVEFLMASSFLRAISDVSVIVGEYKWPVA
jgi:hypothetical protein